jgi:hypothetical protein
MNRNKQIVLLQADYEEQREVIRLRRQRAEVLLPDAFIPGKGGRQGWLWVFARRVRAMYAVWRCWTAKAEAARRFRLIEAAKRAAWDERAG